MLTEAQYLELAAFRNSPRRIAYPLVGVYRELADMGCIYVNSSVSVRENGVLMNTPETWRISPEGKRALEEFEKSAQKHSDEKRQNRFNKKVSIAQLLVPFVILALGLVADNFNVIVTWIVSIFK